MNSSSIVRSIALLGVALSVLRAEPIPQVISYQGRLVDSGGAALAATTPINRKMVFRLYDAATGGSVVWTEQQFVTVSGGDFSVLLGRGTPLAAAPHAPLDVVFGAGATSLYLELTVDNGDSVMDASDAPMSPRQRIVTSGFAFRAHSAESITPGSDLRFLPSDNAASADYGLGFYDSSRLFDGKAVNGPVLFGQGGGALGSATGSTKNLALTWLANGNVGVGINTPTERLHVAGNIKATGNMTVGGSVTAGGGLTTASITAASFQSTGAITGTTLSGTNLSIVSSADNTEVASISADGALTINGGGTMNGPTGNVLNITSAGRIKIRELVVTGTATATIGGDVAQVLSAQKRLVLGGATGWGDSVESTPGAPVDGANAATGMRVILAGTDAGTDLAGFGMVSSTKMFSVAPPSGSTAWYGGTTQLMSLDSETGLLTTKNIHVNGAVNGVLGMEGSSFARLTLSQTATGKEKTKNLVFTNRSEGNAQLGWLKADNGVAPLMTFKRTTTDTQIEDQVGDLGYVGINTSQPKAPLHVFQSDGYDNDVAVTQLLPAKTTTAPIPTDAEHRREFGVYTGVDGGVMGAGGYSTSFDGRNQRYEFIAAIFEGDIISRRAWSGLGLDSSSDARAKQVLGITDNGKDLDTLMKLQITDYHWIDRTVDQHRPHKRLIAQQVQKVFPQAAKVSPYPQVIPSVYELAADLSHDTAAGTLTITTKKAHGFKAGDLVDLFAGKREMKETKVKAVPGAHQFVIDLTGAAPKSLFVYGKQVNDFRSVDYDAISMLNLSATQALKKQNDQLAAENEKLKTQLTAQEDRRLALEKARHATDAKFAALEALLNDRTASRQSPPATPVLLRK